MYILCWIVKYFGPMKLGKAPWICYVLLFLLQLNPEAWSLELQLNPEAWSLGTPLRVHSQPSTLKFNVALCPQRPYGLFGRGAQDSHLDIHTAPDLWTVLLLELLLYVHRDHKGYQERAGPSTRSLLFIPRDV